MPGLETLLNDARLAVLRDCPQLPPDDLRIDWDPSVLPYPAATIEPGDPRCFVVRLAGSWTTLPIEQGMGRTITAIASAVQDHIVDTIWRPWPELVDQQGRSDVLDVTTVDGQAVWVGRGFESCAVGDLLAAAARQHLTVR